MSKFHRLFEDTQGSRAYFHAASTEPLQEASIAKMNRKAKAAAKGKMKPSANQKPYNSLSAQEKKVVDKQVAADAKGIFDGYGKVVSTKDGPMLVIEADPIKEYANSEDKEVTYFYISNLDRPNRWNVSSTSIDPPEAWDDGRDVDATLEDFANGSFKIVLRPYLVGFDKVQYLFDEDQSEYKISEGRWTDLLGYWDEQWLDSMMFDAKAALGKGGLKALERVVENAIPSVREIMDTFRSALTDNNVNPSDF